MTTALTGTRVLIRYFAAACAAAGVEQEWLIVESPATVGDVLRATELRHGPDLASVFARCSYLLDEVAVHAREAAVRDGQALDVLPPFAGG